MHQSDRGPAVANEVPRIGLGESSLEYDFDPFSSRTHHLRSFLYYWSTNAVMGSTGTRMRALLLSCLLYTSPSPRDRSLS
eukprot:8110322-Pyramimonas_sp.AAC.1